MIKHLKIYTDLNDDKTYAYCTYDLHRNYGKHIEQVRIDLLYTDKVTGNEDFKAGMPVYDVRMNRVIIDHTSLNSNRLVFNHFAHAYDQFSILGLIGDFPEHRDFLNQIGIQE